MRNPWSPPSFQGGGKKRNYFEGWYFKHSGGNDEGVWSFIPGLALGDAPGSGYAFVQAIEGKTGTSWWFQYPAEDFHAAESGLDIRVGKNRFTDKGIEFDLSNENSHISGAFAYGPLSVMKFPFWSPGVMGPFSFVPKMECNHGLVSLDHRVDGKVEVDGRAISLVDGRGYIEKDWGHSMPESWIWTQSNDFPARGDSVMLSVARIPWLGSAFRGFLCVISHGGEKHLFATYNGSHIDALSITDDVVACSISRGSSRRGARVRGAKIRDGKAAGESLEIRVTRSRGGILRAPVAGLLSRRIAEAVDARLAVRYTRRGLLIFEAESSLAGLEIAGNVNAMMRA